MLEIILLFLYSICTYHPSKAAIFSMESTISTGRFSIGIIVIKHLTGFVVVAYWRLWKVGLIKDLVFVFGSKSTYSTTISEVARELAYDKSGIVITRADSISFINPSGPTGYP